MNKKIRFVRENTFYHFLIIITVIIIISPILIKLEPIRKIVQLFLVDLGGNKGTYLSMLGGLIGSLVAINGALATQRKINKESEREKIKKCAKVIEFDFSRFFYFIKVMYISNRFDLDRVPWKVKLNRNWDENIIELNNELSEELLNRTNETYDDIYILSCYIDKQLDAFDEVENIENLGPVGYNYPSFETKREEAFKKYKSESNKIIDNLANKILSQYLINKIESDIQKSCEKYNICVNKDSELDEYKKENQIPEFLSLKIKMDMNQEILGKYNEMKEENKQEWSNYRKFQEDTITNWTKVLGDKFNPSVDLKDTYLQFFESIEKIYK